MFRNFIVSAIRNLIRNKTQSIIQILSLAIGLMVFAMTLIYLYDELTVDNSNSYKDQVYRLEDHTNVILGYDVFRYETGDLIIENVPEVENLTRFHAFHNINLHLFSLKDSIRHHTYTIGIPDMAFTDSSFFEIFPQEFLLGDPKTALASPNSVVLTESISQQLFGSENPMGRTVNSWNIRTVTGVIKDPVNTHLKFDVLFDLGTMGEYSNKGYKPTYVKLAKHADIESVHNKINDIHKQVQMENNPGIEYEPDVRLNPLKEVHFTDQSPANDYMESSDPKLLRSFFFLGLAILLIGIINYVNLTTARAMRRRKEIALKKIVGSSRSKLIVFFLTESVITTFVAFLIALTLLQLLFNDFNNLLQANINLYFLRHPASWLLVLLIILVTGILSGIYPAVKMSSGSAILALSGDKANGDRGIIIRRTLMVIQFTMAVVLMIGILQMHLQIRYMKNMDLGFEQQNIVWTHLGHLSEDQGLRLITKLQRIEGIEKAGMSGNIPGRIAEGEATFQAPGTLWDGLNLDFTYSSPEFFEVYGIEFTHGGEILDQMSMKIAPSENPDDSIKTYCMISESCRKAMKLEDPIGVHVGFNWYIMGVFNDIKVRSLKHPVKPLVIRMSPSGKGHILNFKIKGGDINKIFRQVEEEIHAMNREIWPNFSGTPPPRLFYFFEDSFNEQYKEEDRIQKASNYFFILAMIIACLGLFGLSTFMAQRRTKEIGIRKALGSSVEQVFMLLAKDFIKWVAIAVLIGLPAGWYVMKTWQQQFAYKADIGIWIYIIVALIAFFIALLTVAWQSLKTARTNPVDSLRYE